MEHTSVLKRGLFSATPTIILNFGANDKMPYISKLSNGKFQINIMTNSGSTSEIRLLRVCRFCLDKLKFDGFNLNTTQETQKCKIVSEFLPGRFFDQYPKTAHTHLPMHNDADAPFNDYTKGFPTISHKLREEASWKCASCNRSLAKPCLHRFLHVHHLDGNRWNNVPKNLKAICISCHAEEHGHNHIKNTLDYKTYTSKAT